MRIDRKPWGVNRLVYQGPHTEVWHASINAAGQSTEGSQHRHGSKVNDFYVLSGVLLIHLPDQTVTLKAGQTLSVPAGTWHRFEAVTDVELIETYWLPAIDQDDIERERAELRAWGQHALNGGSG